MRRLFALILLMTLCFSAFGAAGGGASASSGKNSNDKYNISVKQADDMLVSDKIVTLTGNVVLSLKTTSDDANANKDRELHAQKIVFNLDEKLLQASGNVLLKEDKDTSFDGDAISLNWENLDVVVFGGGSSSAKKNTQNSNVTLRTMGNRVSYEGDTKTVFFEKGVVSTRPAGEAGFATRAKDTYWGINASQIGMSNSDLFLKNATFRIGRVPFFWIPFFYYPGVQLAINPAMGISSDKGMFLNTTYELYGKYPRLGTSGGSASSSSSGSSESSGAEDSAQAALAIFSKISSGDGGDTVRDGLYYKPIKEVELSKTEKWARKTGSYMALFGDAYENKGISLGFDTKNKTEDGSIQLDATGILAYRNKNKLEYNYYEAFRYSLDLNLALKIDNTSLKFVLPLYSDPLVKKDFLNRNTVFGLDAVFGQEQKFPTTYNTSVEEYRISLTGNSNHSIKKKYSLNITNIDSYIKYKWKPGTSSTGAKTKDDFVYEVVEAKLPSFTLSSAGTLFNLQRDNRTVDNYQTELGREFAYALSAMPQNKNADPKYRDAGLATSITAPSVTSTKTIAGAYLRMSYTYNQTVNNFYSKKLKHSYLATSINPTINIEGAVRDNLINFTETINPVYSGTLREGDFSNSSFTLRSSFTARLPKFGLSYTLTANTLVYTNKNSEKDVRAGKWDNKDITAHRISFSKTYKAFTFGLSQTLKPLTETLSPSIVFAPSNTNFSREWINKALKGLRISADTSFGFTGRHFMDASTSHASLTYNNSFVNFSFSNTLDHTKNKMEGYTASQSLVLYPIYFMKKNQKLSFRESISLHKEFEAQNFSVGAYYDKNYIQLNYKGKDFEKDNMRVHLNYKLEPKYWWLNRIGFESEFDSSFTYDFNNKYGSSFSMSFSMSFAINKLIDMRVSLSSANNAIYKYYDNDDKFRFKLLWEDLVRSFDYFGSGRKSTNFIMNNLSLSFIHNLEDWNIIMEARGYVDTVNGRKQFKPEISIMVRWNAIPEIKLKSKYNETNREWVKD